MFVEIPIAASLSVPAVTRSVIAPEVANRGSGETQADEWFDRGESSQILRRPMPASAGNFPPPPADSME
jgi:hypothetical protein